MLTKVFCNLNGGIECLKKSLFFEWKNTGRYDIVVQMIKMKKVTEDLPTVFRRI